MDHMARYEIGIFVFNEVEELDAVGPYQVFGTANQERPDLFRARLVGETGEPIECVNGLRIVPHFSFADAPNFNVLVIPGGRGTRVQAQNQNVLEWVWSTAAKCEWVASVCSGARITLATGLADGKRITTHHGVIEELRAKGQAAEVLDDVRFVRDGKTIHSAGISAGIDMSLWLVGHLAAEPGFARLVQKEMEYYPAPPHAFEG